MTIDNQFIQHYEPLLRKLARRYQKQLLTEDDLVQEAWLALLEKSIFVADSPPSEEVEATIYAYARKAMQEAICRYEYPVRLPAHPLLEDEQMPLRMDIAPDGQPLPITDQSISIEEMLTRQQTMNQLNKAISRLPILQQTVIRRLLSGASYEEIAAEHAITLNATYMMYKRAIKNIKKLLGATNFSKKVV